mmetsp:Transcript_33632/g.77602  ORF Transcript_33632/g.77602 Transcript_33632/m.77602 type:complete len:121 (-) Transcript_33632:415-777(-)
MFSDHDGFGDLETYIKAPILAFSFVANNSGQEQTLVGSTRIREALSPIFWRQAPSARYDFLSPGRLEIGLKEQHFAMCSMKKIATLWPMDVLFWKVIPYRRFAGTVIVCDWHQICNDNNT